MPTSRSQFIVQKLNPQQCKFVAGDMPDLQPGQILLEIDRFAFTANNVTYAELGERLSYWQYFPSGEDGWGNVPVWGFGDVAASRHDAIRTGDRLFGFLPMATHVVLQPDRATEAGFVDAGTHRRDLPPAYNLYRRTAGDPAYAARDEDLQCLLRPLFITSFLIDDYLSDENFFGARNVVISSASSKTAFGIAHLLHRRGDAVAIVGLTSAGNRGFVEGLGCYHRVLAYEELGSLPAGSAVFVDLAGSGKIRQAVHERYRDDLKFSMAVGLSHRDQHPPGKGLPGAGPVFFFAPDRLRKRAQDWGRGGIDERFAGAWRDFVPLAGDWLTVKRRNRADVESVYAATLAGEVPPETGHILSLRE